jgi:hypothetical protein
VARTTQDRPVLAVTRGDSAIAESHAQQYFPALAKLSRDHRYPIRFPLALKKPLLYKSFWLRRIPFSNRRKSPT